MNDSVGLGMQARAEGRKTHPLQSRERPSLIKARREKKKLTSCKTERGHHCQPEIKARKERRATHILQKETITVSQEQKRDESNPPTARRRKAITVSHG